MPEIDWSKFDDLPESTCWCKCDWGKAVFLSHVKAVVERGGKFWGLYSRKPCPFCGCIDNLYRVESTPESFTIRKEDIREG